MEKIIEKIQLVPQHHYIDVPVEKIVEKIVTITVEVPSRRIVFRILIPVDLWL